MTRKTTTKRAGRRRRPPDRSREPATTGSVVSADWRARYDEHGGSCGDALAQRLRKHIEAKDGTVDIAKLRVLAEANGVWRAEYANLNVGMQRLNIGNRLRALVRAGGKVAWGRA